MDHYAVQIESMDVEALSAHLRRHGVDPGEVRRRYGAEGYGSSIYITDPDGNTVELKGPPEPGQTIPGAVAISLWQVGDGRFLPGLRAPPRRDLWRRDQPGDRRQRPAAAVAARLSGDPHHVAQNRA